LPDMPDLTKPRFAALLLLLLVHWNFKHTVFTVIEPRM
jgi:hypothetical protein